MLPPWPSRRRAARAAGPVRALAAVLALALLVPLLGLVTATPAAAATALRVTPVTWDVLSLHKFSARSTDMTLGPDLHPVGAEVCNDGDAASTLEVDLVFTGTPSPYLSVQGPTTRTFNDVPARSCVEAHYSVKVQRTQDAHGAVQGYVVRARAADGTTASTPTGRQLVVRGSNASDHLSVRSLTGPASVSVGQTVTYRLEVGTATANYQQLKAALALPPSVFQLLSATATSSRPALAARSSYLDVCGWNADPASTTYLSCRDSAAVAGGTMVAEFRAKVVGAGSGTLTGLAQVHAIKDGKADYLYNSDHGALGTQLQVTATDSDVALTTTVDPVLQRGARASLVLTTKNTGSSDVTGPFTVVQTLPVGLTLAATSGTGYSCTAGLATAQGQQVTCELTGTLSPGGSRPLQVLVDVDASSPATVQHRAELRWAQPESTTANNSADTTVALNSPPVTRNDTASTVEGTSVAVDPRAGDTDPDGDPLTVTSPSGTSATANGSVVCGPQGCTYTPKPGFTGTDGFTYTVSDGRGGSSSAVVNVLVGDRPPAFTSATTNEQQTVTASTGQETPPGGELAPLQASGGTGTLSFTLVPGGGSALPDGVTLRSDGSFAGRATTPGTWTARIELRDSRGSTDTTTLTVRVLDPRSARLSGSVFDDLDGDGVLDAGEPGLSGVSVTVLQGTTTVGTATTAVGGTWAVGSLARGTYQVRVTPPAGRELTTASPTTHDLDAGEQDGSALAGLQLRNGTVVLSVFDDHDRDGVQEPGEAVRKGASVRAEASGRTAVVGVTNDAGNVVFTLPSGTWTFTVPGHTVTTGATVVEVTPGSETAGRYIGLDVNRPPVARADAYSTPRGKDLAFDPRTNDTDPDGDPLTVQEGSAVVSSGQGTVTCSSVLCTFRPGAGFEGTATVTYTVLDGRGLSATATASVRVGLSAPMFTDAPENTAQVVVRGGSLARLVASDPDGDTLTFSTTDQLPSGITLQPDGTFAGTVAPDVPFGSRRVTVQVAAGSQFDTTSLLLVVNPVQERPVAGADAATTSPDVPVAVEVLANDTPATGTVTLDVASVDPTGSATCTAGSCTYRPHAGTSGPATFAYVLADDSGAQTRGVVRVRVASAPVLAYPARQHLLPGQTPVQASATDADRNEALTYTAAAVGGSGAGVLPPGVTLRSDGLFTGRVTTPGAYRFDLVVTDRAGLQDRRTVLVLVDTAPRYAGSPAAATRTVAVGGSLTALSASDPDTAEGDVLTHSHTGSLPPGVNLAANGTFTGTPTAGGVFTARVTVTDAVGASDSVDLTITVTGGASLAGLVFDDADGDGQRDDGEAGVAGVTVGLSGQPARTTTTSASGTWSFAGLDAGEYRLTHSSSTGVATTDLGVLRLVDGQARADLALGLQRRDTDVPVLVFRDDDRDGQQDEGEPGLTGTSVLLSGGPVLGTSSTTGPDGTVVFPSLPAATYTVTVHTPEGTSFTTPAASGTTATRSVLTVSGTATPVQRFGVRRAAARPVAHDDVAGTSRGAAVTTPVLANDVDADGDALTVGARPQPRPAFLVTGGTRTTTTVGAVTCSATACTFTPPADFSGTVEYDYTATDGELTDDGTVRVTVGNAPPVFTAGIRNTAQDVPSGRGLARVTATDLDGDTVTYEVVPVPQQGLPPGIRLRTDGTFEGVTTNLTGEVTRWTVTVRATSQGPLTDETVLVVRVLPAPRPPAYTSDATNTSQVVAVGEVLAALRATDPDGDLAGFRLAGGALPPGVELEAGGRFRGAPTTGGTWSVVVEAFDVAGLSASTTLAVRVTVPVDRAPVLDGPDTQTAAVGAPLTALSAKDPEGLAVAFSLGADGQLPPGVWALDSDGTFAGTPDVPGTYEFPVVLTDPAGNAATVRITVVVPDAAPTARDDAYVLQTGTTTRLHLLGNDTDAAGSALAIVEPDVPGSGTLTCTADSCDYTATSAGTVAFTYGARSREGLTARATVRLTVGATADLPPAFTTALTNTAQEVRVGNALTSVQAVDPEGGALAHSVDPDSLPPGVTGIDSVTGAFTGAPTRVGSFVLLVSVRDLVGGSDTTRLLLTVTNRVPVAVADSLTTRVDRSASVDVLANDSDPDGQPLRVVGVRPPEHGTVSCTATGRCTYVPDGRTVGTDAFTVTITDGAGGSATSVVTVTLTAAPVAAPAPVVTAAPVSRPSVQPSGPAPAPSVGPTGTPSPSARPSVVPSPSPSASGGLPTGTPTVSPTATPARPTASASAPAGPPVAGPPVPTSAPARPTAAAPAAPARPAPRTQPVAASPARPVLTAGDDRARTVAGTPLVVDVLANDGPVSDRAVVKVDQRPAHGTASCSPSGCSYVPARGFTGTDTFTYTVVDGRRTVEGSVTVLVTAGPPVLGQARDDAGTTVVGRPLQVPVLGNDVRAGTPVTAVVAGEATHGSVTCGTTGCTYVPDRGFVGRDSFGYTVTDATGHRTSARVTVVVTPGPDGSSRVAVGPPTGPRDQAAPAAPGATPVPTGSPSAATSTDDERVLTVQPAADSPRGVPFAVLVLAAAVALLLLGLGALHLRTRRP